MARKKLKLSWVMNENSRFLSLKKRRLGLVKKVREITILCDVKACLIMFSPNEAEPMVWPTNDEVRELLHDFFALPAVEKMKKESNLESYLEEKTKKAREQLRKSHKKNTEYVIDQLMMQLHRGRGIVDLNLREISQLRSLSMDKITSLRKKLEPVQQPPLLDPPMHMTFQAQSEELRTSMINDVLRGGNHGDEAAQRINIGGIRDNQSRYLMDQWFFASSEPPTPRINQQMGMNVFYHSQNPNPRSYLQYQGSSSNGNPNLEMEPIGHQVMSFQGLVGSPSQPLHHHNMNIDPRMAMMSQPMQYPFALMNREVEVKEERSFINNDDPQFHRSSNTITINNGLNHEPPPSGTIPQEDNIDPTQFDISRVWDGSNNNHF